MGELIIADHALKHGLSPIEIESAWKNYLVKQYRGAPNEGGNHNYRLRQQDKAC